MKAISKFFGENIISILLTIFLVGTIAGIESAANLYLWLNILIALVMGLIGLFVFQLDEDRRKDRDRFREVFKVDLKNRLKITVQLFWGGTLCALTIAYGYWASGLLLTGSMIVALLIIGMAEKIHSFADELGEEHAGTGQKSEETSDT